MSITTNRVIKRLIHVIFYMMPEKFKNSSQSSASMTISDISHRDQMINRVRDLVHLVYLHMFVTVMQETRYRALRTFEKIMSVIFPSLLQQFS